MGRPNKYDDNFPLLAQDYARQGMIDKEIATKLGISERSYYEYQKQYPQFMQAIKRGKAPVDVEVENALLKRAQGYEYEETHVEYKPGKDKKAKLIPTAIRKIKKQVVPDVTAQIFWLKNRRPDKWRDKQEIDFRQHEVRREFESQLDEYFEEQGKDGIIKFFKGLGTEVVPRNQRSNH